VATSILSQGLRHLWRIWRWRSSQTGPSEIELDLPIQTVADVQRVQELGSANGPFAGYWRVSVTQTHAIAGEINETLVLGGAAGTGEYTLRPGDDWAWYIEGFGSIDVTAALGSADIYLPAPSDRFYGPTDANPADGPRLLIRFTGQTTIAAGPEFSLTPQLNYNSVIPRLIPFPAGVGLGFRSEASVASTIALEAIIWVGPIGVMPPGMA